MPVPLHSLSYVLKPLQNQYLCFHSLLHYWIHTYLKTHRYLYVLPLSRYHKLSSHYYSLNLMGFHSSQTTAPALITLLDMQDVKPHHGNYFLQINWPRYLQAIEQYSNALHCKHKVKVTFLHYHDCYDKHHNQLVFSPPRSVHSNTHDAEGTFPHYPSQSLSLYSLKERTPSPHDLRYMHSEEVSVQRNCTRSSHEVVTNERVE
mmetsp:Transcript_35729/g.36438  ORF Transcript_35729/g.36438 Transcript_35729/m.36438 type:complete len:204 (-) Transcript_35729:165-776(-)